MKSKHIIFLFLLLIFSSCKKEGCTDELAINTTAGAKKDDGSCTYQSAVVFWHNASTKSYLNINGVSSLNYYLDGTYLGTSGINTVYVNAPDCSEATAFVREIAYNEEATKVLNYEVTSQSDQVIFSGSITFKSGECISHELTY